MLVEPQWARTDDDNSVDGCPIPKHCARRPARSELCATYVQGPS